MRNRNSGITLVEMLVAITISSLITLAALSMLLFTMHSNRLAAQDASGQASTKMVSQMLGRLATNGQKTTLTSGADGGWTLNQNSRPVVSYLPDQKQIVAGGNVLVENIASTARFENNLLTYTITVDGDTYESALYFREGFLVDFETIQAWLEDLSSCAGGGSGGETPGDAGGEGGEGGEEGSEAGGEGGDSGDPGETPAPAYINTNARRVLLALAASQYGSDGSISEYFQNGFTTFSEWYTQQPDYAGWAGWDTDTPWCACFVSWVLDCMKDTSAFDGYAGNTVPRFASVPEGVTGFVNGDYGVWHGRDSGYAPIAGDLIFFNFNTSDDVGDHVGFVAYVDEADNMVYTIEGNTGGQVAVRSYSLSSASILGYGVLKWAGE